MRCVEDSVELDDIGPGEGEAVVGDVEARQPTSAVAERKEFIRQRSREFVVVHISANIKE